MRTVLLVTAALLLLAGVARAESPYDSLQRTYGLYVDADAPSGWAIKVKSVTSDPYKFWRGTKDLFFVWSVDRCRDWYDDKDGFVSSHGDVHLGNVGTYLAGDMRSLAFGLVDFDDSAELPFQIDLLQAAITLRLIAAQNGISVSDEQFRQVVGELLSSYAAGLGGGRTAGQLLGSVPDVQKLLARAGKKPFDADLAELTENGQFRRAVVTKKGEVKDVFTAADDRKPQIARALADLVSRDPWFGRHLKYRTAEEFQGAIKSVALRTRIGSSGSQGLDKLFILLDEPFAEVEGDGILYLKQQLPTAATRSGVLTRTSAEPARGTVRRMLTMCKPVPLFSAAVEVDGKSYYATVRDPWSNELDAEDVKTLDDLVLSARVLGTVVGVAHAGSNRGAEVKQRLTPRLTEQLLDRSRAYVEKQAADFASFNSDPRTAEQVARVKAWLAGFAR